jgi:hypothetical protein
MLKTPAEDGEERQVPQIAFKPDWSRHKTDGVLSKDGIPLVVIQPRNNFSDGVLSI